MKTERIIITLTFSESITRRQREDTLWHVGNGIGDQIEELVTEAVEENRINGRIDFDVSPES